MEGFETKNLPEFQTPGMARHRIAVIGGDGIGPEVTGAACEVLEKLQSVFPELKLEFSEFD